MTTVAPLLRGTPYVSYTYAYPHKTAYRPFAEPLPLESLWSEEDRQAAFLYVHIPFCEMRCGFCNLFTTVDPSARFSDAYLDALERQARRVSTALSGVPIARMALGGGTPTFLDTGALARVFALAHNLFGIQPGSVPTSVETSPQTATREKMSLLRALSVDRVSIGVQSFSEAEARAAGRSQRTAEVEEALDTIRTFDFPTLNIDLIYGLPGQTVASWLESLRAALRYRPEELYLYPLYVRPLTGLARHGHEQTEDDLRLACYREGRALLLAEGYSQVSLRMFRAPHAPVETGPVYCMQDDGMIGLGCGARSYTRRHHYSSEYAVGASGVRAILEHYMQTPTETFGYATYGFQLDEEEQRRRYVLKSLLEEGELKLDAYQQRFGSEVLADLPELRQLLEEELARDEETVMMLTPAGIERSDAIGPWLYSERVKALMKGYVLR